MAECKKRYVVTFAEEECDASQAAKILKVQKKSMYDGFETLEVAESLSDVESMHFEQLGTSVVSLDEDDAKRLNDDERVAEVVEDFEVEAHGCGCGGGSGRSGDTFNTKYNESNDNDQYAAGYENAIQDLISQLSPESYDAETNPISNQSGGCPPGRRELCFNIFGRRFCFCVPDRNRPVVRQPIPWNIEMVQANRVWHRVTGAGVRVAILDTGIDDDHPDLSVSGGVSFVPGVGSWDDDNGHGTHCAGIAGARHNTQGVVGVAPGCNLYGVKVLRHNPATGRASGALSWILAGMGWCETNGIGVASMSLGSCVPTANAACTLAYQRAAERLNRRGCIVISSAGNSGRCPDPPRVGSCQSPGFPPCGPWVGQPARCPAFMAVAAVDRNRALANFSSRGPAGLISGVEIAAPGVNVRSTLPGGGYGNNSGTSMSCPHVAGAAALLMEQHPSWTPDRVRNRIRVTADDLGSPGNDPETGSGLLNCHRAVFG